MRLSLKISLLASFVGAVFILLVFSNIYKQIVISEEALIIKQYQSDLKDLTDSFDLILNKATEAISLSTIIRKKVIETNPSVLHKRFEIYMKTIPQINKMTFITKKGKELVIASRDRLFEKLSSHSFLKEDIFTIAMKNKIYYSDIYFEKRSNEMMIDISKAVKDLVTQKIVGVITIQVSMGAIQELISNKLINGNGIALLNLNNNQYLYKSSTIDKVSDSLDDFIQKPKISHNVIVKDDNYIVLEKEYDFNRLKMKIIIANSSENVFFDINETFIKNIQLLLIIIVFLAIVMFLFINYLLKPLKHLQKKIQQLSKKISPEENLEENKNLNELESIKQHFYFFIKLINLERNKLEEYNKNLQQRVEEEVRKNKEKEELLAHQSKMASMGEMLENIAHQWRQPLSVISTAASGLMLQKQLKNISDEEEIERLNKIMKTTQYLSETITSFSNFFRQDKTKTNCNLKDICFHALNIIESKFKNKNVEIITNINDLNLYTYDGELTQVIMNILTNAHDILKKSSYKKFIFIDIYQENKNAIITIKDNGGGIADDIIDKIFEPYFTTKFKSSGTGIGLYMSQEIITKNIGGTLGVKNETFSYENNDYKGASFTITIPIVP